MTKIKVLSDSLANKIAAGEVIEKVSSVVKELVENSIDAGSSEIKIFLINSGLKEISVVDNGCGMAKDDVYLSLKRHATSKLKKDDDLFFISTLGFRGEAIPSIASVSKFSIQSSTGDAGIKLSLMGDNIVNEEVSDARKGTSIVVKDIFFNTPARLKFLKSEGYELSGVVSLIERLALSNPGISFILKNNDKTILSTSGSNNLHKTIHELYGMSLSSNMYKLEVNDDDFYVEGYVSKPEILKSNRNYFITFVNNRFVKSYIINKAINDAYYTYKPHDKYPVAILNIEVDPTLIDVNIHPSKQEIKISKENDLYNLVYFGIKKLLVSKLLIPEVKEVVNITSGGDVSEIVNAPVYNDSSKEVVQSTFNFNEVVSVYDSGIDESIVEVSSFKMYPVGLVHGTYIIAQNEEGMYVIDQHAAAERIKYEDLMNKLNDKKYFKKSLIVPINITFSASDYVKFNEYSDYFSDLGFTFIEFGMNTILVKEHPDYLKIGFEEESIRKIIDLIINHGKVFTVPKFLESIAITLSCKMSIKANHNISESEMEYFLNNLVKCDNPFNCPHGRPTIIKYTNYELEKLFKRVM